MTQPNTIRLKRWMWSA